jgi:hypothetical protein
MRPPVVLRARGARPTRRGLCFGILAVGFFFAWLLGTDALLRAAGLPGPQRPGWLRGLMIVVALTPIAIGYVSLVRARVGRALGLTQGIVSRAVIDPSGIELSVDGSESEHHRWDDIVALERDGRDWRLVGPGDSTVTTIPHELARPRPSWSDAPTLAETIVEIRPDRYALRGGRFEPGLTEFAVRASGDPAGRPRSATRWRMLAAGIALFVVATIMLFWILSERR